MKFKILTQKLFIHIEKILCYPFKLKYLNQKGFFYLTLKKYNFFSCEHRV